MEKTNNNRNMILTPHAPQCRICQFAGYARSCNFFSESECPQMKGIREIRKS